MGNNRRRKRKARQVLIAVKDLCKSYHDNGENISVFDNFNLEIREGEFLSISGRMGSGKTTLIHLLGGLEQCHSGEIIFQEQDITKFDESQMTQYRNTHVGFVFEKIYIEKYLNVLENVKVPLLLAGVSEKEMIEKAEKALEIVGLKDKRKCKATTMVEEELQRMCIARAIVNEPKILLIDGITENLGDKATQSILEVIKELNKQKMTILLASRNMTKGSERNIRLIERSQEHES